jgi:DNA modification methylase
VLSYKEIYNYTETLKNHFYHLLGSNLDFKNENDMLSRHTWHSFPARFPPALPNHFIKSLTHEDDVVLDPMAGSFTTVLESVKLNRRGIGFDIDPLSLAIGRAKLQNIKKFEVRNSGNDVLNKAVLRFINEKEILSNELANRFDAESIEFLNYWYAKETQLELISLITQIEGIENEVVRDFLILVFSSIIITKSGGVSLSYDLAHTRPHRVEHKEVKSAFDMFKKRLARLLSNDIVDLPEKYALYEANAKKMPLGDNTVDLIVTSPPYANNAIDYMRAHKFSLVWLKHSINQLKGIRKEYIGSETIINDFIKPLPSFTTSKINTLKAVNERKARSLERYYSEMLQVFGEMYRVLKNDRGCVIIVATSVLSGIDVEIDKCLSEIGEQVGFEMVRIGTRTINRDKRMMPARNNNNQSQIESRMHNEFIIGFWKNK